MYTSEQIFCFSCDKCDFAAVNWHELEQHHKSVHDTPILLKQFECDHCEFVCFRKNNFEAHVQNAHGHKGGNSIRKKSGQVLG